MAAPYRAAPATTPRPMPTDEAWTGADEPESELPGAPFSLVVTEELAAAFALLIGVPPLIDVPARTGIEGSIILISVLTDGFGLVYSNELGLSSATDRGSTMSAGMYAMANVVMYPRVDSVLYGCRYCMTTSD
jgi:hypothetical protein